MRLASLWLLPLTSLACAARVSEAGPHATAVECDALAVAACARLATCDLDAVLTAYGSEAQCASLLAAQCPEALARPGAARADAVRGCTASLAAMTCERLYDVRRGGIEPGPPGYRTILEACDVRGTARDGDACVVGAECASGSCTLSSDGCGVCQTRRGEGAPCTSWDECAPGLYCKILNSMSPYRHECHAFAPLGGACSKRDMPNPASSMGCRADAHCVDDVCVPRVGAGEACDGPTAAKQTRFCRGTLRCKGTCYDAEADLRATYSQPIVDVECDEANPHPESRRHCRRPASCVAGRCQIAPLPVCPSRR